MMYSQPTEGQALGRTGPVPMHGMCQPAALTPLCGLLQLPRIWLGQTMRLTVSGMQVL